MSTGKAILIVAGVGAGAFVLFKALAPSRPVSSSRPSGTSAGAGTSLSGLLTPLLGLIGAASSSNGNSSTASYFPPVNSVDTQAQAQYGFSHGVVEQEGNQLIDLNTGNAVSYGPGF